MNNIERLKEYISRVEGLVANTKRRMTHGEGWLDAQLASLEHHLDDLRKQLILQTETNCIIPMKALRHEEVISFESPCLCVR